VLQLYPQLGGDGINCGILAILHVTAVAHGVRPGTVDTAAYEASYGTRISRARKAIRNGDILELIEAASM
jgi:hypothetical protein